MLELPIKILKSNGQFDDNSPTIIMLCGQGSSGKTTFWRKYLRNKNIVAMDDIIIKLSNKYNYEQCHAIFHLLIEEATKIDCINDVVLDFAHDTIDARKDSLIHISSPEHFNFLIIHLSLDFEILIENDKKRKQVLSLPKEQVEQMKKIYNLFIPPVLEEFKDYNFKSITLAEYKQLQ